MIKIISPALVSLLSKFIDYAGIFPPAKLSLDKAISNFIIYQKSDYAWILRYFVLTAESLKFIPEELNGYLSVISNIEENRASSIESTEYVETKVPLYCEVSTNNLAKLVELKKLSVYAKIRTGGLKQEQIPSVSEVANFIRACKSLNIPFKATAGLHHPLRGLYPLCYESDSEKATMHGFINVLAAAAFAWVDMQEIEPILAETDPEAFVFDQKLHWRDYSLTVEQIKSARNNFIHSVGSCSFEEPISELQALLWL